MKLRIILSLAVWALVTLSCGRTPGGHAVIAAKAAKKHVGENTVVSGTVTEIFVSRQNTNVYLYLDGGLPKVQFAAVWLGTNDPPITGLQDLIAKSISVSGKIAIDQGVPEIIVKSWDQIEQQ